MARTQAELVRHRDSSVTFEPSAEIRNDHVNETDLSELTVPIDDQLERTASVVREVMPDSLTLP